MGEASAEMAVSQALHHGRHLLDVFGQMVDVIGLETGCQALALEVVDLRAVLDDCLTQAAPGIARTGLRLVRPQGRGAIPVTADPCRLRRVVLNLLSNAVKFNRPGGTITVVLTDLAHGGRLTVADSGPGIPPHHHPHIFSPFHRVEPVRRDGAGLGLFVARELVQRMGGSIGFWSRCGAGTTFWVNLPRTHAAVSRPAFADLRLVPQGLSH